MVAEKGNEKENTSELIFRIVDSFIWLDTTTSIDIHSYSNTSVSQNLGHLNQSTRFFMLVVFFLQMFRIKNRCIRVISAYVSGILCNHDLTSQESRWFQYPNRIVVTSEFTGVYDICLAIVKYFAGMRRGWLAICNINMNQPTYDLMT